MGTSCSRGISRPVAQAGPAPTGTALAVVVIAAELEFTFAPAPDVTTKSPVTREESPATVPPLLPNVDEPQSAAPSQVQPPAIQGVLLIEPSLPLTIPRSQPCQRLPDMPATFIGLTSSGHRKYRVGQPFRAALFESSLKSAARSRALKATGHMSVTGHMWTMLMLEKAGCTLLEHEAVFHFNGETHHPDLLMRFRDTGGAALYIHCEVKASSSSKHRALLIEQCGRACARLGIAIASRGPPPPRCVVGVLMHGSRPHVAYCEGWMKTMVLSMFYEIS